MKNVSLTRTLYRAGIPSWYLWSYFLFPVIPPFFIRYAISNEYKFWGLIVVFVAAFAITVVQWINGVWTPVAMGFARITRKDAIAYFIAASIASTAILLYGYFRNGSLGGSESTLLKYTLIGSPLQTFLYQSFLMKLGRDCLVSPSVNIGINTIVFSGMHHLLYPNNMQLGVGVIPAGLLFSILYERYPNSWLAIMLHMVLNGSAAVSGIIH